MGIFAYFLIILIVVFIFKIIKTKKHSNTKYTKKDAIKCWSKIFNYKYTPQYEDRLIIAGRIGENFLKDYISGHPRFRDCKVFGCKRLYNKELNRKNEIDMIVVSDKKIYVIECKNWKGDVIIENDIWKYITNVNGESVITKYDTSNKLDPVNLTKMKSELLYKNLKELNISIDMRDIVYKVIFVNKNMKMYGDIDKQHIILYDELYHYMDSEKTKNEKNMINDIIISLLNIFMKDEEDLNIIDSSLNPKIGKENRNKMLQYLESLPTWDYIELSKCDSTTTNNNDIKIYQGDVKRYENIFNEYIDFKSIKNIKVKKDNNKIVSLINVLLGAYPLILYVDFLDGKKRKFIANPEGYIIFQESGHPETENIDLLKISNIKIGAVR